MRMPPHCPAVPPSSPPPRAMPACAAALSDPSTDRMLLVCRSLAVWKTSGITTDPAHHSPPPLTIVEAAQVHSTHSPSLLTSRADRSCRRLMRSLKVAQQVRVGHPRPPPAASRPTRPAWGSWRPSRLVERRIGGSEGGSKAAPCSGPAAPEGGAGALGGRHERALTAAACRHAARMHPRPRCHMSGSRRVARRRPTSLYVCRVMCSPGCAVLRTWAKSRA